MTVIITVYSTLIVNIDMLAIVSMITSRFQ